MSKTKDEVKIVLEDNEGKKWVSGETYGSLLSKLKMLEERKDWLTDRVLAVDRQLRKVTKPQRKQAILDFMSKLDVPRNSTFVTNRLSYDEFDWETWKELVDSGTIEKVRRGNSTLYQLNQRKA